jgi:hypothetical protein
MPLLLVLVLPCWLTRSSSWVRLPASLPPCLPASFLPPMQQRRSARAAAAPILWQQQAGGCQGCADHRL